uniref:Uncharacterized protein n=1 Tax=Timema bartmani TaxID=61472 RepID=A0A7R9EYZ1_9NEOP|nr:unnamed protein product [Timema bartmani]
MIFIQGYVLLYPESSPRVSVMLTYRRYVCLNPEKKEEARNKFNNQKHYQMNNKKTMNITKAVRETFKATKCSEIAIYALKEEQKFDPLWTPSKRKQKRKGKQKKFKNGHI